jgi:transcriptional regulator with XRE-family HTH domain
MSNTNRIANHVGNRIRQIREQKKISLLSLAFISNIEYSHLCKIEFGKLNTSIGHLVKIANALNVNLVFLFTNKDVDIEKLMQAEEVGKVIFTEIHELEKLDCNGEKVLQ